MKTIEFHPLANLFPLIEGDDFDRLVEDIAANGLRDKIIMLDGQIIDGRNRYRALIAADLLDPSRLNKWSDSKYFWGIGDVGGDADNPLAWVLSKNLHRRHLNASQRAMIAASIASMRQGERTDLAHSYAPPSAPAGPSPAPPPTGENPKALDDQGKAAPLPSANLQKVGATTSVADAADQLKVSPRSVASAKKVIEQGAPGLAEAVQKGKMAVSAAADLADLPVDEQVRAIESADPKAFAKVAKAKRDQKTAEKKQARTAREQELGAKQLALPDRRFGVIYADPEWKFEPYSQDTGMDRSADNHYPTSDIEDIRARDVGALGTDDCVLFLWATVPMVPEALEVLKGWGFTYRSQFIWAKARVGTGYWNRNAHEILLVGTRGNIPAPAPGTQWPSVIKAPVGKHSEKPEIFHFLIEHYFPSLPKIELNARKNRPGWTIWGLDADGEDLSGEPLLENPGLPSNSLAPPGDGIGGEEPPADRSAPSRSRERKRTGASKMDSAPPKESFTPPSQAAPASPAPPPISARVNIGELELLVRVAAGNIRFYAMQTDSPFPAENGWVEAACVEDVNAANLPKIAKRIWGDVVPDRGAPLHLPAVTYRMGRTGPVPVNSKNQAQEIEK